jgi:glycosyltransferase involved in cell wall biosynthesis
MSRRIAVVFPLPLLRPHLGKDLFLIPQGLQRLGFEAELHCPVASGGEWPLPVVEAGADALLDPGYWRGRGLDGAIVFSFLRHARLLAAVRAAGVRVVAKADTTGQVIARRHPRPTLEYAFFDPPTLRRSVVSVAYWLARVGPLHRREAMELVRAMRTADATVVETQAALEATVYVLERAGAASVAKRIVVVPNPVGDAFVGAPVPVERERLVVAVGSWNLRVKDARLLVGALERFLAERADYRAVVVGPGGERSIGGRAADRIDYVGQVSQAELVPVLGRACMVVTSSRWESFSLSSHEGLALGCTVVGPQLAPLGDILELGPYGTISERRDAAGLARALATEAIAWDRGERDPVAGAAFWRRRLAVGVVAERIAGLL